jgi:antitoxin PrlF
MEENLLHNGHEEFPERALEEEDPTVAAFLELLADDIEKHPERLQGMPEELLRSILELTEGIQVDLDEPIEGPVAL